MIISKFPSQEHRHRSGQRGRLPTGNATSRWVTAPRPRAAPPGSVSAAWGCSLYSSGAGPVIWALNQWCGGSPAHEVAQVRGRPRCARVHVDGHVMRSPSSGSRRACGPGALARRQHAASTLIFPCRPVQRRHPPPAQSLLLRQVGHHCPNLNSAGRQHRSILTVI